MIRISELAERTGVSVHRLRRYEADGLIRATRGAHSGYREFDERTVREVIFLGMGREIGLSLKVLADALPRFRAGTLSITEMIDTLERRIAEVDAEIVERQALRERLVSHIAWFEQRRAAGRTVPTVGQRAAGRTRPVIEDQPGKDKP